MPSAESPEPDKDARPAPSASQESGERPPLDKQERTGTRRALNGRLTRVRSDVHLSAASFICSTHPSTSRPSISVCLARSCSSSSLLFRSACLPNWEHREVSARFFFFFCPDRFLLTVLAGCCLTEHSLFAVPPPPLQWLEIGYCVSLNTKYPLPPPRVELFQLH